MSKITLTSNKCVTDLAATFLVDHYASVGLDLRLQASEISRALKGSSLAPNEASPPELADVELLNTFLVSRDSWKLEKFVQAFRNEHALRISRR